ncbi:ScbA/BarX family gamma-butyrolactone biosynthesis protein [Streptomyces sp. NPDC032472]|uniref:ScbA/BarX family gamma-butyrolactone biosynthesis protein n=1 Tax=Streptomyces sp. NPDC032472 TaxID=3155018 RepID=UPI0033F4C2B1
MQSTSLLEREAAPRPMDREGVVSDMSGRVVRTEGGLSFDQTVPRSLVHRASVAEVFLTDARRVGPGVFRVAAQWPRGHGLYRPTAEGLHDPVLVAETIRQAGIYLSHTYYGVPLDHRFVIRDLAFRIEDPQALVTRPAPPRVVLDIAFTEHSRRTEKRFGGTLDAVVEVEGRRCARASLGFMAVDADLYLKLRHRGGTPPQGEPGPDARPLTAPPSPRLPQHAVGRSGGAENVVLAEDAGAADADSWRLHVDTGHVGFFEHPSDHVPGMLLVEAFRQAGHVLLDRRPAARGALGAAPAGGLVTCEVTFDVFGELHAPVVIAATGRPEAEPQAQPQSPYAPGVTEVVLAAVQDGRTLARARVGHRPAARTGAPAREAGLREGAAA